MLPNKGVSPVKPGEKSETPWSPLMPKKSEAAYQIRMGNNTDAQEGNPKSSETDRAPISAKLETQERYLDL
jgi:hypothetical protein